MSRIHLRYFNLRKNKPLLVVRDATRCPPTVVICIVLYVFFLLCNSICASSPRIGFFQCLKLKFDNIFKERLNCRQNSLKIFCFDCSFTVNDCDLIEEFKYEFLYDENCVSSQIFGIFCCKKQSKGCICSCFSCFKSLPLYLMKNF
ncbi:uncharacterized protein LOC111630945 [Centruroides sculpturatus]|uniref:uncharacterized protein LOC111630945 n=1 Tax=Centruroides sculpturatus TaxID=218467 RepID=UPI000C6E85FB|nr:uncharacterized protein LOC111630944 isoform X2 [Centruroides sculpturatus]XP_023230876.1 uncharacterized protein LOC111630945 [Centruroides sculpturatus]